MFYRTEKRSLKEGGVMYLSPGNRESDLLGYSMKIGSYNYLKVFLSAIAHSIISLLLVHSYAMLDRSVTTRLLLKVSPCVPVNHLSPLVKADKIMKACIRVSMPTSKNMQL